LRSLSTFCAFCHTFEKRNGVPGRRTSEMGESTEMGRRSVSEPCTRIMSFARHGFAVLCSEA